MRTLLSLMPHRPATYSRTHNIQSRRTTRKFTPTLGSPELETRVLMTAVPAGPPNGILVGSPGGSGRGTHGSTTPPAITNALSTISSDFGLNVALPKSGVQFSTFTTANEPQNIKNLGLPLRSGVTYYDAILSSNFTASFGNNTAGNAKGVTLAVVVDPADPCVYVSEGASTTFQYGVSAHGLIPFNPAASNYSGQTFSGQLWGSVQGVPVGDLPVSISGDVTINLNGANDNQPLNIGKNAYTLFKSGGLSTAVLPQIDLGVNGTLSYGPTVQGIALSIPIANASFSYIAGVPNYNVVDTQTGEDIFPGGSTRQLATSSQIIKNLGTSVPAGYQLPATTTTKYGPFFSEGSGQTYYIQWTQTYSIQTTTSPTNIDFAGSSADPLQGTKLAGLFQGSTFAVQASTSGLTPTDFLNNLSATFQSHQGITIAGYSFPSSDLDITVSTGGASISATDNLFGANVTMSGAINFATGGFELGASINSTDLPFDASASAAFYYDYAGHANGLYASISASFDENFTTTDDFGNEYGFDVSASLTGTLYVGTDGSFDANLDVEASGTIFAGALGSFGASIGADAEITNHSLSLSFNDGIGDTPSITINF